LRLAHCDARARRGHRQPVHLQRRLERKLSGTEIIEVFPDDITASDFLRFENFGRSCHDIAVFLGGIKRGVCAGGNGWTSFRMDPNAQGQGSITNPHTMHNSGAIPDVTVGHTATFTWDGSRFVFGHEPGGGTQAQCEEQDPDRNRMFFMYDTASGEQIGEWFMPNAQSAVENCTLHNINFIPTTDGSDLLVSGNYQAGTWVTDWTDPANPSVLAFADMPPINPAALTLGGAWSTYWYNRFLYETEITRGLNVFGLNDPRANMVEFDFLNPQTQMQSIGQNVVGESRINIKHTGKPHRFQGLREIVRGRLRRAARRFDFQAAQQWKLCQCRQHDHQQQRKVRPPAQPRWSRSVLRRCSKAGRAGGHQHDRLPEDAVQNKEFQQVVLTAPVARFERTATGRPLFMRSPGGPKFPSCPLAPAESGIAAFLANHPNVAVFAWSP
jgi:hypothetical protein